MNYLMEWWGILWHLYLKLLAFGNDMGGLVMLLVWLMGTAAAFVAMVVAPVVLLFKLLIWTAVLALKASLMALLIGGAMQVVEELDKTKQAPGVTQLEPHQPNLESKEKDDQVQNGLAPRQAHRLPIEG